MFKKIPILIFSDNFDFVILFKTNIIMYVTVCVITFIIINFIDIIVIKIISSYYDNKLD